MRAQFSLSRGWTIAAILLLVSAVALWCWRAAGQVVDGAGWLSWRTHLMSLLVAVLVGAGVGIVVAVIAAALNRRAPAMFVAAWVTSAFLLATMGAAGAIRGWWVIIAVLLLAMPLVGFALGTAFCGRPARGLLISAAAAALSLLVVAAGLIWPGDRGADGVAAAPGAAVDVGDPLAPGKHQVQEIRYGSGRPGIEPDYGPGVAVTTDPVDGSALVQNWAPALTEAWGFDAAALPLNGTVWRPADAGKYPLVLIAHGNATVGRSELGFRYLGEALAARGYIVVAIDQNFLNTGVLGGATSGLDAARAWLILEHLRQWRTWSEAAGGGALSGIADLSKVSLIGHSRGGEAVATAAAINPQKHWPGNGFPIDYGFDISTVIAIAPSDGLYSPDGKPVELKDVNYLTFAGSYDADVLTFAGARQYARTAPAKDQIKSAILLDRLNHTQFNQRWGRYDGALGLAKHVLSTGVLVEPQIQQQVALGYVSAFLDLTIKGSANLRQLFERPAALPTFVPGLARRQQFAAGGAVALTPDPQAQQIALPTRTGESDNPVLALGGDAPITFAVAADVPVQAIRIDLAGAASTAGSAVVTVTDRSGRSATLPLVADNAALQPLPGQFTKLGVLMPTRNGEPALNTYTVPAAAITEAGLDPRQVVSVAVALRDAGAATVYVDNVGIDR